MLSVRKRGTGRWPDPVFLGISNSLWLRGLCDVTNRQMAELYSQDRCSLAVPQLT